MIIIKKEIYIHVGIPRTATTFLQENVFPNMDLNFFNDNPFVIKLKEGKNLISNESLYGDTYLVSNCADNIEILDRLKNVFPDAKLIVVFREKNSWIKSCYHQYCEDSIRRNKVKSFKDWHQNIFNKDSLNFLNYFYELKDRFDVLVLQYEELLKNDKSFVKKICDFINIEIPSYVNERINFSLDEKHYNFLRLCDRVQPNISNVIDGFFKNICKKK